MRRNFANTNSRFCISLITTLLLGMVAIPAAAQQRGPMLAVSIPAQDAVSFFDFYREDGARLQPKKSVVVGKNPGRMCADSGSTLYVATAAGASAIDVNT